MLDINLLTPSSVMEDLKSKYKNLRLALTLTQASLAKRSGVSLGSLKRFESSGKISLESFLKLSLVLECLDDFKNIANPKNNTINSIDELINKRDTIRKRGRDK
jgi:transcriptional regulator with XRE-family HTH domain